MVEFEELLVKSIFFPGFSSPQVSVVGHDWGASLCFHWCNEHRDRVLSIAHMESLGAPLQSWEEIGAGFVEMVQALRTDAGLEMVLQQNMFIEQLLPGSTQRELRKEEMDAYREPYLTPGESRRPTLTWAREMPVVPAGPADVVEIASAYSQWLKGSESLPKLFVKANPGSLGKEAMIQHNGLAKSGGGRSQRAPFCSRRFTQ